jgi:hypothetical protein
MKPLLVCHTKYGEVDKLEEILEYSINQSEPHSPAMQDALNYQNPAGQSVLGMILTEANSQNQGHFRYRGLAEKMIERGAPNAGSGQIEECSPLSSELEAVVETMTSVIIDRKAELISPGDEIVALREIFDIPDVIAIGESQVTPIVKILKQDILNEAALKKAVGELVESFTSNYLERYVVEAAAGLVGVTMVDEGGNTPTTGPAVARSLQDPHHQQQHR